MKIANRHRCKWLVYLGIFLWFNNPAVADDTCMFSVTADEVPPNIVVLLDNGAEMQQIVWHSNYVNSVDYTPAAGGLADNGDDDDEDGTIDEADEDDFIRTDGAGSGFFNSNGYGIAEHGGSYYLVEILDSLVPGSYDDGIAATTSDASARTGTWTINEKTITLPTVASAAGVDDDGIEIKDNAGVYRYSKNYLNWIFFNEAYEGDGSDLPHKSRFYAAKKAILNVAKVTSNKAFFGLYNFTNNEGSSQQQPLSMVVDTVNPHPEDNILDENFVNKVNNMVTFMYSPLAEGLATIGGYYDSPSSQVVSTYCQKNFVLVVSPGISSMDRHGANQYLPSTLSDYDGDESAIGEGNVKADSSVYAIPKNLYGTTWLDDVAYYMYTNDMVGYQDGFQNVMTYTVGFMGDNKSNLFLINTSNNGNGNPNLFNTSHLEYGKYHFSAESPDDLTSTVLAAVNSILSQNLTLTAPVVPVTKTMSSNKIYLALFKPTEGNFWEGNIVKFGINEQLTVVGSDGQAATWPNGAIKEDAKPYWSTKDWADDSAANGIHNSDRNIYTYLGGVDLLTDTSNQFVSTNSALTNTLLGNPSNTVAQIINHIRGADVFDEDADADTTENREVITGDILHSQPLVVQYNYSNNTAKTMVYYGSNDGMLHAVKDTTDSDTTAAGGEQSFGREAWAFIPPDLLPRLKDIVEGVGHQFYVDSSPKVYIKDVDGDGYVDTDDDDKVIVVCGERKGGKSYFALDVTVPETPKFLWRIAPDSFLNPNVVISELGESWSEPQFGLVKTSDIDTVGTPVFFIGGGYSSDNSAGKAVLAINVFTGAVVKKFVDDDIEITAMDYSIASTVNIIDENNNGFVDKIYVGDLGGQMWRIGQFDTDGAGNSLVFPDADENINNWKPKVIFSAPSYTADSTTIQRKFFSPPSVALEKGYDLVFMGTGDRDSACSITTAADRIYVIKDIHGATALVEADLVDVTSTATSPPDLDDPGDVDENGHDDQGWYIQLVNSLGNSEGEKVLSKGTIYYKTFYITTFIPNEDPCLPGGNAKMYALDYKTGSAVMSFSEDNPVRGKITGGGIPSNPVPIITMDGQKLLITVGSTLPDAQSQSMEAGIVGLDPLAPDVNLFYLWWREL
jgi:type IV pilus assembly protein PilY1